jgi:hypothetical protein
LWIKETGQHLDFRFVYVDRREVLHQTAFAGDRSKEKALGSRARVRGVGNRFWQGQL